MYSDVLCPTCGNEFHIRESAMRPDGSAMTVHCPYCGDWLIIKGPVRRQLQATIMPFPEPVKPRLDFQVLASAVETASETKDSIMLQRGN